MIRFVRGNLFESRAEALVNTVNCVGVMGKGIAYQFKRAYPMMFNDYAARCRRGELRVGEVSHYRERDRVIINFPTKHDWRGASKMEDIVAGLQALRRLIVSEGIHSIALPPLGCGNGGLEWSMVKPAILAGLDGLPDVDVEVFEPIGHFESRVAKEPRVSLGHFVLAGLRTGLEHPTKLTMQKAAYFFNVYADTDYFRFTEYKYGPYCPAMDPMFNTIRDYLDYTGLKADGMVRDGLERKLPGTEAERLKSWFPAMGASVHLCNTQVRWLEAIATTHAIIAKIGPATIEQVIDGFFAWSPEKAQRYEASDVRQSVAILERQRLVGRTLLGLEVVPAPIEPLMKSDTSN